MAEQAPALDGGTAGRGRRIVITWLCLVAVLIAGVVLVVRTDLLHPPAAASRAVVVPNDLTGANAVAADDRLRAVGFKNVVFVPDGGGTVVIRSRWTVRSVDGAGTAIDSSTQIIVRVTRGSPANAQRAAGVPST